MQIHVSVLASAWSLIPTPRGNIVSLYPFYDARRRKVLAVTKPWRWKVIYRRLPFLILLLLLLLLPFLPRRRAEMDTHFPPPLLPRRFRLIDHLPERYFNSRDSGVSCLPKGYASEATSTKDDIVRLSLGEGGVAS